MILSLHPSNFLKNPSVHPMVGELTDYTIKTLLFIVAKMKYYFDTNISSLNFITSITFATKKSSLNFVTTN